MTTSSNAPALLEDLVERKRQEEASTYKINDYFEIFVADQTLKKFDLDYEEIKEGIVGGGGDGGIDSIYLFVNGMLINDSYIKDNRLSGIKEDISIEIFVLQTKFEDGFKEEGINKFAASAIDIFNLKKSIAGSIKYNTDIQRHSKNIVATIKKLNVRSPRITFRYFYATKGETVHPNIEAHDTILRNTITAMFPEAKVKLKFLTAAKLMALSRKTPVINRELQINKYVSTKDKCYINLVNLVDYFNFIVNEDNKKELLHDLFESNVRDYQGEINVNKGIRVSLETADAEEDFWWLNNGVTIIAKKASVSGETISLKEPQIVNGLQTSYEIFRFFSQKTGKYSDPRNILVRVVVPKEESSTFKIIKANNSQTKVPEASLRATDEVHRDIEEKLLTEHLFYERRKNFYKNKKKPINSIISITYMAQVITAICLQEPNNARARPANLLKDEKEYVRIFSDKNNTLAYLNACKIQRLVEDALRNSTVVAKPDINNIKYHVAMTVSCRATNRINPDFNAIAKLDFKLINTVSINQDIDLVYALYTSKGATDTVAKSTDFVTALKTAILTTVIVAKSSSTASSKSVRTPRKKGV